MSTPPDAAPRPDGCRILFYTHTPRSFRTTLIWYLHELSQAHTVSVLAHEGVDAETRTLLEDKNLFPGIVKVESLAAGLTPRMGTLSGIGHHLRAATRAVVEFKPEVVICSSDWHSLIEMQLLRCARKFGALSITIQDTLQADSHDDARWADLLNIHLRTPKNLPMGLRHLFVTARKWTGHLFFYWLAPVLSGVAPFAGTASFVLYRGTSGSRESDCHVVFSNKSRDYYIRSGTDTRKLRVLAHPFARGVERRLFDRLVARVSRPAGAKVIVVLDPGISIGFTRAGSLIDAAQRNAMRHRVLTMVLDTLSTWQVLVKPHPDTPVAQLALPESPRLALIDRAAPIDQYIATTDAILELPLSNSTVLYTASLQRPEIPVLSLDLHHEFRGQYYSDGELGIEYVNSVERLSFVLQAIREGLYRKQVSAKVGRDPGGSGLEPLLDELLRSHRGGHTGRRAVSATTR